MQRYNFFDSCKNFSENQRFVPSANKYSKSLLQTQAIFLRQTQTTEGICYFEMSELIGRLELKIYSEKEQK